MIHFKKQDGLYLLLKHSTIITAWGKTVEEEEDQDGGKANPMKLSWKIKIEKVIIKQCITTVEFTMMKEIQANKCLLECRGRTLMYWQRSASAFVVENSVKFTLKLEFLYYPAIKCRAI